MRKSSWTPSIVPKWQDQTVYLVLNDFGRQGRAWCETDTERTDLESVISDLMAGQYKDPVSVAAFNLAERWANDVSEDIALEIPRPRRCRCPGRACCLRSRISLNATPDATLNSN